MAASVFQALRRLQPIYTFIAGVALTILAYKLRRHAASKSQARLYLTIDPPTIAESTEFTMAASLVASRRKRIEEAVIEKIGVQPSSTLTIIRTASFLGHLLVRCCSRDRP